MKPTNILVTGPPGCGKSTLIERVAAQLKVKPVGFITREIRERGHRAGFSLETFDGQRDVLAHVDFETRFRVGKYGVRIEAVDRIAVGTLHAATAADLVIIDEIGKMECLSEAFRNAVLAALTGPNPVIATIAMKGDAFMEGLKARKDVTVITMTRSSRGSIAASLLSFAGEWIEISE